MMVLTLLLDVECLYSFFNSSSKDYFPESLFLWAVFIVFPSGDMNLSAGFPLFTCPSEKFKFNFVFQTKCKISNFLHLKTIPLFFHSDNVYKCQCGGCNPTYYGKTK